MGNDSGRSTKEPGDSAGGDSPVERVEPILFIEPDISLAPPPPAWKEIALPKPLPGSMAGAAGRGKSRGTPAWELYGVATEFIVFILVFTGIGWVVDHYAGTGQIGVAAGSLLGIVLGGWRLIRGATRAINRK